MTEKLDFPEFSHLTTTERPFSPYEIILDDLNYYRAHCNETRRGMSRPNYQEKEDGEAKAREKRLIHLRNQRDELHNIAWEVQRILNEVNGKIGQEMNWMRDSQDVSVDQRD